MVWKTRIEDVEAAVTLLTSLDISKEAAQSIIIKLWYLVHYREDYLIFDDKQEISIKSILVSSSEPWVDVLHDFEIYKVSEIKMKLELFKEIEAFIRTISINVFMFAIKDDNTVKMEGHFYSPYWIVDYINNQIKDKLKNRTVIDISAGLGHFLKPLLKISRSKIYAIELDHHVFEAMIFEFFFAQGVNDYQKAKLILTVKNGDSLLGYDENLLDSVLEKTKERRLLLNYRSARKSILNREVDDVYSFLPKCFELREELTRCNKEYKEFNWYLDYPELFIDHEGRKLTDSGVDYVVGNPPWVNYSKINLHRYEKIFKQPEFISLLKGKFNFFLPFAILAQKLSKRKGGLVLPQTLFTESYAQKFREFMFKSRSIHKIILYGSKGFRNVINEFCTLIWDNEERASKLEILDVKRHLKSYLDYTHILPPFYRLPLLPSDILEEISKHYKRWSTLDEFISTRRGFTLTRKYQKKYSDYNMATNAQLKKRLIKNSEFKADTKKGVFNFQVFYAGDVFIYDKELLGAPGKEKLFEQPKIIRRNRGRKWLIGLDMDDNLYVNDIFDIIYTNNSKISLKALFGYLCSSYIQLITEGYLQRDITSNIVRFLPIPHFNKMELTKMEKAVDVWLNSHKNLKNFKELRNEIDHLLSIICEFSTNMLDYLRLNVEVNWKEL